MRRLFSIPRLPRLSSAVLSRLRWLLVGGVLAAITGNFAWRIADAHLQSEATRQVLAGKSAAVVAMREDWCVHVVPVAITAPGKAGDAARKAGAAKINYVASRAMRGDLEPLRRLAPQLVSAIRSIELSPTEAGGRWGEWVLRRLATAGDELPTAERVDLLVQVDNTLTRLTMTPRSAPVDATRETLETPPPDTEQQPIVVVATPPAPLNEVVVRPVAPTDLLRIETPPAEATIAATAPRVASQWRRPERDIPTAPAEPATFDPTTMAPATLGDRELLGEALRIESLLAMSPDGAPRAMGPSQVPAPLDANEAPTRTRLEEVRRELVARGYAGVSRHQVEGMLLPDARERAAFVESLLTDRNGDPARVLLLMAGDDAPEVRAAAISALGGSSNRALVTKALELAMQDQDLRVGRLVEPIRARLR